MQIKNRRQISETRKKIEKELEKLLKQTKNDFCLNDIKEIIYNENDQNDLIKIMEMFDNGQDIDELNKILAVVNDAWNYFPHKCLGDLSPAEKILETND